MPAVAAGSQEQHTALEARPPQRAGPAPPPGADPRQELLCVLELCGRALLEQHQASASADGWVCAALGMGGKSLRGLKTGSALGYQQEHGKSSWWEVRKGS